MKIALVHDYLKEYGGAERVLETFHEIWPDAPLYTSVYLPDFLGPHQKRFRNWDIRTTFLQSLPFKEKLLSFFRFFGPLIFKSINLKDYDVVLVSASGTYTSPNYVRIGEKTTLITYYHTPPRYLYGYPTATPWRKVWWRKVLYVFGQIPMHLLRILDFKAAQIPNFVIANSHEVAKRIKKFYARSPIIIYPPVDIPKVSQKSKAKGQKSYFLAGGRLARPKRIDLAVSACTKLGLPLKVFGKEFAGYGDELKSLAGPTVEFLGEVTDEKKSELMAGARAYIFPSEFEDFGITPVEAMAVGAPVIALRSGGVMETVIEGKTGVFFNQATTESLVKVIKKFTKLRWDEKIIKKHAKKFSKERFVNEFKKFVTSIS